MTERISKKDWYMEIARIISLRSTCLRAHAGAIVVKNDAIISTDYSGRFGQIRFGFMRLCDVG